MTDLRKRYKNPLLLSFLSNDEHYDLVQQVLENPTEEKKRYLDRVFKDFYIRVRVLTYMSKVIHFEAKDFDKKIRKEKKRMQTTLNSSMNQDEQLVETLVDTLPYYEKSFENGIFQRDGVEALLINSELYKAFFELSHKQRNILYFAYVRDLKDVEIAKLLGVSQQSVSKTRNTALKRMRGHLK